MILYRKCTVSLASSPPQLSGGQHADWLDQTKAQSRGTRPQGRARDTAGPEGRSLAGSQGVRSSGERRVESLDGRAAAYTRDHLARGELIGGSAEHGVRRGGSRL